MRLPLCAVDRTPKPSLGCGAGREDQGSVRMSREADAASIHPGFPDPHLGRASGTGNMLGSCHFMHTQRSLRLPRGAALASSLGCSSSYSALDTDLGSGARPLLHLKGTRCLAAPLPVAFHPGGDALWP